MTFSRRRLSDASATFIAQVALLVTGLITGVITARVLGTSGRGLLALAVLLPTFLALICGFGSGLANLYFVGSGRYSVAQLTANTSAFVAFGTALATALVAVLQLTGALSAVFAGVHFSLLVEGLAMLPVLLAVQALNALQRGMQRLRSAALVDSVQGALSCLATAGLLLWANTGVAGALGAVGIGALGALVLLLWLLRGNGMDLRPRLDPQVSRKVVSYGIRGDLANVSNFFNYRLDSFFVNGFAGASAVGVYAVATRLAELLWLLPRAVATVVMARATRKGRAQLNSETPAQAGRILAILLVSGAVLAAISMPVILLLYGHAFKGAVTPLLLLLPGTVLFGAGGILSNELNGRGYPGFNTINSAVTFAVTVGLDLWLIPPFGANGAAVASSVAYATNAMLAVAFYLRIAQMSWGLFARTCIAGFLAKRLVHDAP